MKAVKSIAAVVIATAGFGSQAATVGAVSSCGGLMWAVSNGHIKANSITRENARQFSVLAKDVLDRSGVDGAGMIANDMRVWVDLKAQAAAKGNPMSQQMIDGQVVNCSRMINSHN
jgi:hypothetical protein